MQRLSVLVLSLDRSLTEPIPWADIEEQANQVLRVADNCLQKLEELERLEEGKKDQKEKSTDSNTKQVYRNTRWHIRDFMAKVYDLCDFSHSLQAQLTNLPALLLCGEAGQGKTHLFCDIARRRVDAGFPTILLMGQQFTQAEPWTQIVHQLGLPETSRNDLLGALQAVAQARNAKALLMIDALNEGEGKRIWSSYLPAMLQTLFSYPWISVALSVRSSYEHVVIPGELLDKKLVRAEHYGFAEHEYQATRTFFDYYGIQQPSVPLLVPEFQNPLFLRLLCKGLHETHQSKLPAGLHGITSIFRLFVNAIDEKLWREMYYKHYPKPRFLVWSAINRLAEAMANSSQDWVAVEEAEAIVNQLGPAHEQSLYRILIDEGILAENDRYSGQDDWIEVSQFAYERFSDHFIARYLLDKHLNAQEPSQAFLSGQPLAFLTEKRQRYSGLLAALSIQLPERIGKELPDIVPMIADSREVAQAFIQSIVWRDPKAITDHTLRYLDRYANHSFGARDQILDAILTVAANPQHPYNADFLHTRLVKVEMAERDAWWSTFLHRQYGAHGAVDRLVDWAWSPGDKSHIDDESVRLCGVTLAWFLTTSNRFLRDRATKALVNLLTCRIHVLIEVLEQFRDVNDPYVSERVSAQ